jgi:uncharacterized membrane protein HdeD (DUF308 family)
MTTYSTPDPAGDPGRSEAMRALLAANWWALALRGTVAILFGIFALLLPGVTIASLVMLFAAYALVDGVFAIVAGVRAAARHERWALLILEGLVDIAAGVVAFLWPGITVVVYVLVLATWAVVSGVLLLAAAFRLHVGQGRWWMALGGALSVVWGILLWVAPIAGAVVLTWWLGAYAILFGVLLLGLAFRLRGQRDTFVSPVGATGGLRGRPT